MSSKNASSQTYRVLTSEEVAELRRISHAANEAVGVDFNSPYVPPEELQKRMEQNGVRPEDNIFQRELMKIRYGNDGVVNYNPAAKSPFAPVVNAPTYPAHRS